MIEKNATVVNKLGLHARAAAKLVSEASQYQAQMEIEKEGKRANAKSIMSIMMLAATHGTPVRLFTSGPDEEEAMQALLELFESGFGEGAEPCP